MEIIVIIVILFHALILESEKYTEVNQLSRLRHWAKAIFVENWGGGLYSYLS